MATSYDDTEVEYDSLLLTYEGERVVPNTTHVHIG